MTFARALAAISKIADTAMESGNFAPLHAAFIDAVERARTGDDLWKLAEADSFEELVFSEYDLVPRQVEALLDRAHTFKRPGDIAAAIALACRATSTHPGRQLLSTKEAAEKKPLAGVLDARVAQLRAGVTSRAPAVRIAALHALGCVRSPSPADVKLAARIATQKEPVLAATALLTLAAFARRRPATKAACAKIARRHLASLQAHRSPHVALCALAALASARVTLDEEAMSILVTALTKPSPLPAEWGWRWESWHETTAELAIKIARSATFTAPARAPLVAALAIAVRRGPRYLLSDVAMQVAFGARFKPPPRGVVRDDLDDAQRAALSTLGQEDGHWIRRLGLHLPRDIAPFLAGKTGAWKPLAVGARRWHLWRIWREVLAGDLAIADAAAIITAGLTPKELVDALGSGRNVAISITGIAKQDEPTDLSLLRAIFEALNARGVDLDALRTARLSTPPKP